METASLYTQKVSVVLSGTMSQEIESDAKNLQMRRVGVRILIRGKSTKAVENWDLLSLN